MASFFRKRIAQKVVSLLLKNQGYESLKASSILSSFVKVDRSKTQQPQLIIPWKQIEAICNSVTENAKPSQTVKFLRNQGLPTAEGFIDINLSESPLGIVFTIDKHVYSKVVLSDIYNNENMAKSSCLFENILPKTVVVDCSSPAIGTSFQMTHFRSAIHSNFIANINKFVGHDVVKVTQVGDWGLSTAALLVGYKRFGLQEELVKNPSLHLSEVMKAVSVEYQCNLAFQEAVKVCFEKLQKGDRELLSEWRNLKHLYLEQYDTIYKRIGLSFDDVHFDSSCYEDILKTCSELSEKKLLSVEENGKMKIILAEENEIEREIILSGDINPIIYYLSRFLFAAVHRNEKHNADVTYYVAPSSQKDFYSTLFYLIKKMGFLWSKKLQHVKLKNISYFENGKGKNINCENLLNTAKLLMLKKLKEDLQLEVDENIEEMAEILGLSSLYINDMKHRRNVDYPFKWQDIIHFGRDSGASFQFCHAGLKGLQEDSEYKFKIDIDTSPLLEAEAHYLIQHLSRFDEMVYKAYVFLEPCIIYQYLSSLWYFTNRATNVLKLDIKAERLIVIKARLLLLSATLKVLEKGLHLLGVSPMEQNYLSEAKNMCT